jgi:hypothetical protein
MKQLQISNDFIPDPDQLDNKNCPLKSYPCPGLDLECFILDPLS